MHAIIHLDIMLAFPVIKKGGPLLIEVYKTTHSHAVLYRNFGDCIYLKATSSKEISGIKKKTRN